MLNALNHEVAVIFPSILPPILISCWKYGTYERNCQCGGGIKFLSTSMQKNPLVGVI
jgi:hypothetical protein